METVNLHDTFSRFSDYCNPRVIGEVNECHVKAVKLMIEPKSTLNTGNVANDRTVAHPERL